MFISSTEKINIQNAIESLRFSLADANTEILYLKAKIKVLEGKNAPPKKPKKQSTMSAEGRARIGAAVKAYHAKKKLEKQNATSISTTSI
jgi:hypothetical protein